MKYIAVILGLVFNLLPADLISQENKLKTKKIGKNELIYQLPVSLGYAHTWHIKDKFIFGTGVQLGYGKYFPDYSDFLYVDLFTRNPFSKNKYDHRFQYEIGGFASFSFQYYALFYGLSTSVYIDLRSIKIGIKLLSGEVFSEDLNRFPLFIFAPVFIYKIN